MIMLKIKTRPGDQNGFASVVIALILIVVLALMSIGFAQLARREQRTALDKQLASQAYYAAESGLNDTEKIVENALANPATAIPSLVSLTSPAAGLGGNEDPKKCLEQQPSIVGLPGSQIDNTTGVSYTCTLLNLTPPTLSYSGVSPGTGESVSFSVIGGVGGLDHLTVYWGSTTGRTTYRPRGTTNFTPLGSWSSPAVLQFSITPLTVYDRNSLMRNTFTAYLYPSQTALRPGIPGSVNYTNVGAGQGPIVAGNCSGSGTYPCAVTIQRLPLGLPAGTQYLIHFIDYYDSSNVTVDAFDTSGTQLNFVDGQAQIDVTGRAKNVLKRIQVRAPLTRPSTLPLYTVEGQNVCKRFDIYPGSTTPDSATPGCGLN